MMLSRVAFFASVIGRSAEETTTAVLPAYISAIP